MARKSKEERKKGKKERMNRDTGGQGGVYALSKNGYQFEFFKPERNTEYQLHFLPYLISTDKHPDVKAGRAEIGEEDGFLAFSIHRGIGPDGQGSVLCLRRTFNQPCPICEHAEAMRSRGQSDDLPWPTGRVMYNVMFPGKDSEIMVFEVSERLFQRELKSKLARTYGGVIDFTDLEEGKLVQFYAEEDKSGRFKFIRFKDFEFKDRELLDEDLIDQTIPLDALLNVPTYEQVEQFYAGEIAGIEYDNKPADVSRGDVEEKRRSMRHEDDEDAESEDDEFEDDEDEQEERSSADPDDLEYGDECPFGLEFGKDHDTDKRKCGIECPDDMFRACGKEKKRYDKRT